jgi:hypothetical protein
MPNCQVIILKPIQHESRLLIWVSLTLQAAQYKGGRVLTFEPLGRPSVHVGPEVPLHRRRCRAELRLQQHQHHRIRHAPERQHPGTKSLDLRIREQIAGDLEAGARADRAMIRTVCFARSACAACRARSAAMVERPRRRRGGGGDGVGSKGREVQLPGCGLVAAEMAGWRRRRETRCGVLGLGWRGLRRRKRRIEAVPFYWVDLDLVGRRPGQVGLGGPFRSTLLVVFGSKFGFACSFFV